MGDTDSLDRIVALIHFFLGGGQTQKKLSKDK